MDDHTLTIMLGIAAFICFLTVVMAWEVRSHRERIRKILSEKGATEIKVGSQQIWGDRSNIIYTVDYTDRHGQQRHAKCKIGRFLNLNHGDIYWSEPPEV